MAYTYRQIQPLKRQDWTACLHALDARWRAGQPVVRLMSFLRERTCLKSFGDRVYDVRWLHDFLEPTSELHAPFQVMSTLSGMQGSSAGLTAAIAFSTMRVLSASDTAAWFQVEHDLALSLLQTRLRGVRAQDVQLPLPGLYLAVPPGLITIAHTDTGDHDLSAICVCEGNMHYRAERLATIREMHPKLFRRLPQLEGRRLLITAFCEPNENSVNPGDDNVIYFSLPLQETGASFEAQLALEEEAWPMQDYGPYRATVCGQHQSIEEVQRVLRSFVVNTLLYLSSPEADIAHAREADLRRLRKQKRTASVRKKIKRIQEEPSWVVGSRVVVSPQLREAAQREPAAPGTREVAVNVLVRGHWRRQWHGPKSADNPKGVAQHWTWIRPTIRNPSQGRIFGHNYVVTK